MRVSSRLLLAPLAALLFSACATTGNGGNSTLPFITKRHVDYATTGLFVRPCKEREDAERDRKQSVQKEKKGFFAKLNPVAWIEDKPQERKEKLENTVNDCNVVDLEKMVTQFMSIQEMDEKNGVPGDSISDVRNKGFTIFLDTEGKTRRQNTGALHGNDAMQAVGMGVSPPPLQKPEEIKAYADFMSSHYAEVYQERDVKNVTDRICVNTRDTSRVGEDRTFVILWRENRVFKRIIKGGPINYATQERALFLCPGSFIGDTITGTLGSASKMIVPK